MAASAQIIADSISPLGVRLTTFEIVMHRFVLAEFNTHRLFSRNSASSRAIPLRRSSDRRGMLDRFEDDPAFPLEWPHEQTGMQGGGPLEGKALDDAKYLFEDWHRMTANLVDAYLKDHPDPEGRLHKSLLNRLLEPMMWHTIVVTSTEWDNFWFQRASEFSPLAQPELRATVDLMLDLYRSAEPTEVDYGDWHLPYITNEDRQQAVDALIDPADPVATDIAVKEALKKVSAARCARVSYLTQDGVRDPKEDIRLYDRLVSARPMHASPLEHVATPATLHESVSGNFHLWHQHRHEVMPHRIDRDGPS